MINLNLVRLDDDSFVDSDDAISAEPGSPGLFHPSAGLAEHGGIDLDCLIILVTVSSFKDTAHFSAFPDTVFF